MSHRPSRPMIAASATKDRIEIVIESTSADQEPMRMVVCLGEPAARETWNRGLAAPRARDVAWAANKRCVECGKPVKAPSDAGLVELSDSRRVAHKPKCWLVAVSRLNPLFARKAAAGRATVR